MRAHTLVWIMLFGFLSVLGSKGEHVTTVNVHDPVRIFGDTGAGRSLTNIQKQGVSVEAGDNSITVACDPEDISDDIQAAVDTLRDLGGGTIYLPECDAQFKATVGSSSGTRFPGGINIIGKGIGDTILRSDGSMFFDINHWGDAGGSFRISGISFYGAPLESGTYTNRGISISNIVDFRIDHCYFERIHYNIGVSSRPGYPQSRGVVDHCSFIAADLGTVYGVFDSRVWDTDMKLGTAEATFVEDCYFEDNGHPMASFGGGHYVLRHSTIVNSDSIDAHGPGFDSSGRGARASEIYENEIYHDPGDDGWTAIGLRAGGGVIFNNIFRTYDHAVRFSIDTYGYNATGGLYPTLDQVHNMWIWDNTLIDIAYDPDSPGYQDDLSNPDRSVVSGVLLYSNRAGELIRLGRDFFMRAPYLELDGFNYSPYTYPHPLTDELDLWGAPGDKRIELFWKVQVDLPITSTWQIEYYATEVPTAIVATSTLTNTARSYTLDNLENYTSYTVILQTIGASPALSDTVRVMPTDYLTLFPVVATDD